MPKAHFSTWQSAKLGLRSPPFLQLPRYPRHVRYELIARERALPHTKLFFLPPHCQARFSHFSGTLQGERPADYRYRFRCTGSGTAPYSGQRADCTSPSGKTYRPIQPPDRPPPTGLRAIMISDRPPVAFAASTHGDEAGNALVFESGGAGAYRRLTGGERVQGVIRARRPVSGRIRAPPG